MAMTPEGSVLLVVSAEVLFHDGTNWIRLDNPTNGLQNSALSTIRLIKATNDSLYRIVATRNMDNKRIVDQTIFHRLKYKEATPSFHQWRNQDKQVIGLNFPKEQDARHFYSAIRQALDSIINLQQFPSAPKSQTDTATYQDPQNFNNYTYQQQDIYAANEHAYNEGGTNGNQSMTERRGTGPGLHLHTNQPQQQQNLIRRASQGSNISSSTGGSIQGTNYALVIPNSNCNNSREVNEPSIYTSPSYSSPQFELNHGKQNIPIAQPHQNNAANVNTATSTAPPPPPPPPPELKNALSGTKQSFAEQLRHVQLKKNSTASTDNAYQSKSSPSSANNNSNNTPNGVGSSTKLQTGGNQDFISELADRLNKRKMTTETCTTTNITQQHQAQHVIPSISKISTHHHQSNCHKKIPSGSSLSSQDEANINGTGGTHRVADVTSNSTEQNGFHITTLQPITTDDLTRVKNELTAAFSEELNKLKAEMAQIIRIEIAKLTIITTTQK